MARELTIPNDVPDAASGPDGKPVPYGLAAMLGQFIWPNVRWREDGWRAAYLRMTPRLSECVAGAKVVLEASDYDKLAEMLRTFQLPQGMPLKIQMGIMQMIDAVLSAPVADVPKG
jgi:hypothetical protein